MKVAVVLATYNGARHLAEQVQSIRAQDFQDWTLLARDDGSTDSTAELLRVLEAQDPRIEVLPGGGRLGPAQNFGALLEAARARGAEHVFLSDQDDVWRPWKMRRMLDELARLERAHGTATPLLVHSDLEVVDERLQLIDPSFLARQGIHHQDREALHVLLVQNFVTGCASLVNRALLDLALPIPPQVVMHDWWLAQCAAAGGRIGFLPETAIQYRQHSANQIGSSGFWGNLDPFHAAGRKRIARSWRTTLLTISQAGQLHRRLSDWGRCPAEVLSLVDAYARCAGQTPWRRVSTLQRLGIRRQRPLGQVLLLVRMALLGVAAGR